MDSRIVLSNPALQKSAQPVLEAEATFQALFSGYPAQLRLAKVSDTAALTDRCRACDSVCSLITEVKQAFETLKNASAPLDIPQGQLKKLKDRPNLPANLKAVIDHCESEFSKNKTPSDRKIARAIVTCDSEMKKLEIEIGKAYPSAVARTIDNFMKAVFVTNLNAEQLNQAFLAMANLVDQEAKRIVGRQHLLVYDSFNRASPYATVSLMDALSHASPESEMSARTKMVSDFLGTVLSGHVDKNKKKAIGELQKAYLGLKQVVDQRADNIEADKSAVARSTSSGGKSQGLANKFFGMSLISREEAISYQKGVTTTPVAPSGSPRKTGGFGNNNE